ncbi:helix-turn-helix transcriptional regulator [Devosia sp. 1566]|uniref:helix-turn-helix transcriptional regulator n=1 Tax=Devosia sp. 1566 TaxID=2499144 RepID=UPI0013E28C1E|nr:helix-turn-helix transcriptional regulator [Devosia sp. 1566]
MIDKIYEAAFVPELWSEVLGEIASVSGAHSGALLLIDKSLPPLFAATPNIVDTVAEFASSPLWYDNRPVQRLRNLNHAGFLERTPFLYDDERNGDPHLIKIGADWQVGSVVDMPDGEMALFTFERRSGLADFSAEEIALLDSFRPHLARASFLATRLKLERAQTNVIGMNALGIPASVVTSSGVVLASNALFEELGDVLRAAAFGRLVAKDRQTDRLLQAALPGPFDHVHPEVRSFPMRRQHTGSALVIHVIPLQRSASDIFDSGAAMVAVTGYSVTGNVPSNAVLRGLFDLSAAEAGVATDLSSGLTLNEVASQRRVSLSTVRTHLAQIFRKTGTNQQGQLIALLKGVSGYPSSSAD